MKTLGILGGLGPESTIDYYRSILGIYRQRTHDRDYPHIVINSLDVDRGIAMLDAGRLDALADYLSHGIAALARAGATFGCIAANTPHIVFDEVKKRAPIPLISIVGATARKAKASGFTKVGLFGTGFTMRAEFYPQAFAREGMQLVRPKPDEQTFVHSKYIGELLKSQFLPGTRESILAIARRMIAEDHVEAIALAGTELPLLLRDSASGIEFLDTTVIHVEAMVEELMRE